MEKRSCPANSATGSFIGPTSRPLDVEAELDHVAVLDDVVFAFDPQLACLARFRRGPECDQIVIVNDLGGDEAALEISVNHASCGGSLVAGVNCPRACLFLTGREISAQA